MHITPISHGDLLELQLEGRLDSEWAATLRKAIDDALRQGYHAVVLDSADVSYVSSAGLAVLVSAQKQFQAIRGFFGVGAAGGHVEEVIRLTGLAKMLLCDLDTVRRARGRGRSTIQLPADIAATDLGDVEIYDLDRTATLSWSAFGDPARFAAGSYTAADVKLVRFTEDTCAVGLGAFGDRFDDSAAQFGELLAAAGAVTALPAAGSGLPDYQLARGEYLPQAQMLYGVTWTGPFARLLRFDVADLDRQVSLTDLVRAVLELSDTEAAGLVLLAETSGLVGAALRRSPVAAPSAATSRFDHPEVRDWFSFTPERAFPHALALIVGVAARAAAVPAALQPFVRPLSREGSLLGHFHAAVFPFQPFKKRRVELMDAVAALFDSGQLQGVLHLMRDERPISGAGDSELLRGACWVGPLSRQPEAAL